MIASVANMTTAGQTVTAKIVRQSKHLAPSTTCQTARTGVHWNVDGSWTVGEQDGEEHQAAADLLDVCV
jgi:hypothetical protein